MTGSKSGGYPVALTLLLAGPAAFVGVAVLETVLSFVIFMLGLAVSVGGVALLVGGPLATPSRRQAREADRSLDRERYTAMTWLTELDEQWLADRHFWAIPREVARLRGGQRFDQAWTFGLASVPQEVQHRERMVERAKRAQDKFDGINLTPEVERSEPVSGEVLSGHRYRQSARDNVSFDRGPRQEFGRAQRKDETGSWIDL